MSKALTETLKGMEEAFVLPEVKLKRVHLHLENGKTIVTQRRICRDDEWSVEPTPDFLKRVQETAERIEQRHEGSIGNVTSSTVSSDGTEMVELKLHDLMNRFLVLDYLTCALFIAREYLEVDDQQHINIQNYDDSLREIIQREGFGVSFFHEAWCPSIDPAQAMFLQVYHGLTAGPTKDKKGSWEVSFESLHKHFTPDSVLSLEIVRTVVRKMYADKPVLMPTDAFIRLGKTIIKQGQPHYSTENF
jgi:hypothetical protein